MTNKVGFKHYKDHDGKNIKYYDKISIQYINYDGKLDYFSLNNGQTMTYNDKFESAVIKSKENISNIHRIISIWFGKEIVEEKKDTDILLCNHNITLPSLSKKLTPSSQNTNNMSPELLVLLGLGEYVSETDENGKTNHVFKLRDSKSPQDILLAMEFEKQKRWREKEEEIKKLKHEEEVLKEMSNSPFFYNKSEQQNIMKYPLIYKLKEREDYKKVKRLFDLFVGGSLDTCLFYDHNSDLFRITGKCNSQSNITILDVYKK